MRAVAVVAFLGGLLLAVRVMLFGVQRRVDEDQFHHRRWPLALAAFLTVGGALFYARAATGEVTASWTAMVVLAGVASGAGAWWLVKRSAAIPSTDPEDDPRYRFQGHIARVIKAIEQPPGTGAGPGEPGRIVFSFDGKTHELNACWTPETGSGEKDGSSDHRDLGQVDNEVVIERIEGDMAYVEPWTVVEERL